MINKEQINKEQNSKKQLFINIIIFLFLLSISNFSYSLTQLQSLDSLKDTIIALNVTQKKSEQALNKLYKLQSQSAKNDIYEYSIFIEYLAYQIKTYCLQIKDQYGSRALSGLPCQINNHLQSNHNNEQNIKTSDEQVSSMEEELMNSLGDFDEMLLKEEEMLAQINKNKRTDTVSKSSSKSNGSGQSESNGQQEGSEQKGQEGKQGSKDNKAQAEKGEYPNIKGKQKKSSGIGINERRRLDEIDDDIVARQLKEAAEKEIDPRLKEKLWDEYYNYKKGN